MAKKTRNQRKIASLEALGCIILIGVMVLLTSILYVSATENQFGWYERNLLTDYTNLTSNQTSGTINIINGTYTARFIQIPTNVSFFTNFSLNLSSSGNNIYCYQESFNVSNQTGQDGNCALNYSGNMNTIGTGMADIPNLIDGNWITFETYTGGDNYQYINYSKPNGSIISYNLTVKFNGVNVTYKIGSDGILDNKAQITLRSYTCSGTRLQVYYRNTTGNNLINDDGSACHGNTTDTKLYEEAITWEINNTVLNPKIYLDGNEVWYYDGIFVQTSNSIGDLSTNISASYPNLIENCKIVINGYCYLNMSFYADSTSNIGWSNFYSTNIGYVVNSLQQNFTDYATNNHNFLLNLSWDSNYFTSIQDELYGNFTPNMNVVLSNTGTGNNAIFNYSMDLPNQTGLYIFGNLITIYNTASDTSSSGSASIDEPYTANILDVNMQQCNITSKTVTSATLTFKYQVSAPNKLNVTCFNYSSNLYEQIYLSSLNTVVTDSVSIPTNCLSPSILIRYAFTGTGGANNNFYESNLTYSNGSATNIKYIPDTFNCYINNPLTSCSLGYDGDWSTLTNVGSSSRAIYESWYYPFIALNFTSYSQDTLNRVTPFSFAATFNYFLGNGSTFKTFSINNQNTPEVDICIDRIQTFYVTDVGTYTSNDVNYQKGTFESSYSKINNNMTNVSLYFMNVSESTSFIIQVQNYNQLPLANYYVYIYRYYPSTGSSLLVQSLKTDQFGQGIGFFETEIVDYNFVITDQWGNVVLTVPNNKIIPTTTPYTLIFTVGQAISSPFSYFNNLSQMTFNLAWNKGTRKVTYIYTDSNAGFQNEYLVVTNQNLSSPNNVICNVSSVLYNDILSCDLSSSPTGSYNAQAFTVRNGVSYIVSSINFDITGLNAGLLGIFGGFCIILICSFALAWNEVAGIVFINVGVIAVQILGLINFGVIGISAVLGVSVLIIIILERG